MNSLDVNVKPVHQDSHDAGLLNPPTLMSLTVPATEGIPKLFKNDSIHAPLNPNDKPKASPSFFNRILNYFFNQSAAPNIDPALKTEDKPAVKLGPIDQKPVLDKPTSPPTKETADVLSGKKPFSLDATPRAPIERMTMEGLMIEIIKVRLQMQEEKGAIATATFEKYQDLKKVLREELQKKQDDVLKNEKWASYFGYAQFVAVTTPAIVMAGGAVLSAVGAPIALASASFGALTSAGFVVSGVISTGAREFFNKKSNEGKSEIEEKDYNAQILNDALDAQIKIIMESVEKISKMQGSLIEIQRTKKHLTQAILR
jgi:hypothetical protein